jgi:hypothetical protein
LYFPDLILFAIIFILRRATTKFLEMSIRFCILLNTDPPDDAFGDLPIVEVLHIADPNITPEVCIHVNKLDDMLRGTALYKNPKAKRGFDELIPDGFNMRDGQKTKKVWNHNVSSFFSFFPHSITLCAIFLYVKSSTFSQGTMCTLEGALMGLLRDAGQLQQAAI